MRRKLTDMRALRYHGNRDLRVDAVPPPGGLADQEVLIKVAFCGICGTDLHEYAEGPKATSRQPVTLGHELGGVVEAVGPSVTAVGVGDRVAVMPQQVCGACMYCRAGLAQHCTRLTGIGIDTVWGGFADQAVVREDQTFVIPDDMTLQEAALVEPAAVSLQAVRIGQIGPGASTIIAGAGPIGVLCAMSARLAGAAQVVITDPRPQRREAARALGFDVIDPTEDGALEQSVAEMTREGEGFDVAIDCAGGTAAMQTCCSAVRRAGTVVVAAARWQPIEFDILQFVFGGKRLLSSFIYQVDGFPAVIQLIASGRLPVKKVISDVVPLDRASTDGFDRLLRADNGELKILVEP